MSHSYLKYLSRNIAFIGCFTFLWTVLFFYVGGFSPVFLAYSFLSILFFLLSYAHWKGRDRLTAILFVVVSNLTLLLADEGIPARPMTGIQFLYAINILYAFAFLIEEMNTWFYLTLVSTAFVFLIVNFTPFSLRLLSTIRRDVPDYLARSIYTITFVAFCFRFLVLIYESVKRFLQSRVEQSDSAILFANIEDSICMVDKALRLQRINGAFEKLMLRQYGIEPVRGMKFSDLLSDPHTLQKFDSLINRAFAGEQIKQEHTYTKDETRFYEISFCPMVNANNVINRIGIIFSDITARKKLEMDLIYTQNGLLEMIAHDLKAPLAMIKNVNSLTADQNNQYNKFIDKTCIQTIASIDNVLSFSRYLVTSDTSGYVNENVAQVLAAKVAEMDPNASISGQRLFLKVSEPDLLVRMNRDAFGRAVGNLISNSIKFTEGTGEIHIRVMRDSENFVQIKVSDQGIGIPEDMRAHLFERFTTAGRNGLRGEQSFGLGLYISTVIIKLHGGTLSLDPEQAVGTTFIIRLPLVDKGS